MKERLRIFFGSFIAFGGAGGAFLHVAHGPGHLLCLVGAGIFFLFGLVMAGWASLRSLGLTAEEEEGYEDLLKKKQKGE